jgi:DNA-binding NtrC family response regulator
MPVRTAVFADPDRTFGWRLKTLAQNAGIVAEVCTTAEETRRMLVSTSPTLFFSNVRLGGLRGADVMHLAKMANPRMRTVLYGSTQDLLLARQAQAAGAFFEPLIFLPYALKQYFATTLPPKDRRDPARPERRKRFRGGRRATDIEKLHVALHGHPAEN